MKIGAWDTNNYKSPMNTIQVNSKMKPEETYRPDANISLIPIQYQFQDEFRSGDTLPVTFNRIRSLFYEGERWAVRQGAFVLNKEANWEHEPLPSSRDDAFYSRCRFSSLAQALGTYRSIC